MISTADFHLSESRPSSRTDNYLEAQFNKFDFIARIADNDGLWLHAGDLFDIPKPSLYFVERVIRKFNEHQVKPYVICGQHDLPDHSLKDINKSGLGVLAAAGVIELIANLEPIEIVNEVFLYGVPFGLKPTQPKTHGFNILMIHELVIEDSPEWFGQRARTALKVLKEYEYDLILVGDNHKHFSRFYKDRLLVNHGSVMRKTKTQIEHQPKIFWTDFEDYKFIDIPIQEDVFDLTVKEEETVEEYDSFVEMLDDDTEIDLSFKNNLIRHIDINNIEESVRNKTLEFVNGN